jgi:hypothetical protein
MEEDAPGTIYELGVKSTFSEKRYGNRGCKVASTKEEKNTIKDPFSGLTLSASYAF